MTAGAPLEDRYAYAMRECEAYRSRVRAGSAEPVEEFLRAHWPARELLAAMLGVTDLDAAQAAGSAPATGPLSMQCLGVYRLVKLLGSGGMGEVYAAVDERLGRTVALKLLQRATLWPSQDALVRFRREAVAAASLDHPGICKVYDAGEIEGVPYIAMQLIEGKTLAEVLEPGLSEPERAEPGHTDRAKAPATQPEIDLVLARIEQLARALHHAHQKGFVHRDVKPGNIILTPDGRLVLMDFGLVRDTGAADETLTSSRAGIGTPFYMAPEQIQPRHDGPIDARTDVYALGVTLYECLTLDRPFRGTNVRELQREILSGNARDPRRSNGRISADVAIVLACAMEPDRSRRYASALELADDLRRIQRREPVRARPIGAFLRTLRWTQRHPVVATFLVTMLLGSATSAAFGVAATHSAAAARQNLDLFDLLSDVVKLREAKASADLLYPPFPHMRSQMQTWLAQVGLPLAQRLEVVRAARDRVLARALGSQFPTRETLSPPASRVAALIPTEHPDRFLSETLTKLALDLGAFCGAKGELADVRRRLDEATSIHQRSIEDHQAAWDEAIAAIAKSDGEVASVLYGGLRIRPQIGLVPIGIDPHSRLWEFAHLTSGSVPKRHPRTQALMYDEDSGIVFVLLPPGEFLMGDPDPSATPFHRAHPVALHAFFLAKHEVTQSQWMRLCAGENPSYYTAARNRHYERFTLRHPVETVDWTSCDRAVTRHGLCLPTEAQWEYGCRAGTTTPWWSGAERESLRSPVLVANIADQAARRAYSHWPAIRSWPDYDDGYGKHAPVGSLAPNPFGLYDVHGNVAEWCRDWYRPYVHSVRAGDGLRDGEPTASRTLRGGSYTDAAHEVTSYWRPMDGATAARTSDIGLRASRALME